ncbi:hypothetical protein ACOBMG_03850 [Limosilactobacillus mucosae]|uniref:hypothetical protein n=1 Tax=Limosilactobacillus mucosae TaxID=97478 RepID=UPI003B43421A
MMDLIGYVTSSITAVYQKIAYLYQLEIEVNDDYELSPPTLAVEECHETALNRNVRLWMFRALKCMAHDINNLVTLYNKQQLIDWDADGEPLTPPYSVVMPTSLAFSEVKTVLDDDFKRALELLGQLERYANDMKGD